jgi:hypothetical protein
VLADGRGTWSASTFMQPTNPFGVFSGTSGGYALATRFTFLPIDRGVEGGALGPVNVQSEMRFAVVDQLGGPFVAFSGAYAEATCVLTGEVHPYDYQNAVFRRVMPNREFYFRGGGGALEASLGWAYINLNDKNITGGQNADVFDWPELVPAPLRQISIRRDSGVAGAGHDEFGGNRRHAHAGRVLIVRRQGLVRPPRPRIAFPAAMITNRYLRDSFRAPQLGLQLTRCPTRQFRTTIPKLPCRLRRARSAGSH